MAQKTPTPLTTGEIITHAQLRTNTNSFPQPLLSEELSPEEIAEGLAKYKASVDKLSQPFSNYKRTLDKGLSQSQEWICPNRIPLDGLVLVNGGHGTGKTILMHQIAAAVSSGGSLFGSTPTVQSNVLIVSPTTSVQTYQRPHLTALGADLSRIRNISYIQDPAEFYTSGFRSLSLPNDFSFLLETMDKFHPRLVILDDFMRLLSSDQRMTNERLGRLLTDLRLRMIERHAVCIIVRNYPAPGSHTRPSLLERSDHFDAIATSSLLLVPDPFQDPDPSQPKRLLLSHVDSNSSALAPTLPLQIQPLPNALTFAQLTIRDSHPLDQDSHLPSASDLLSYRHDVLQRQILTRRLFSFIDKATAPISAPTLYAKAPDSSHFQVHRALKDLLNMGLIERPSRGLYGPLNLYAPLNLTQPLNRESLNALNGTAHLPLTNNLNVNPLKTVETPLTNAIDPIEEARRLPKKEPHEIPSIPFHAQPLNELTKCATTPVEEVKLKLTEVAATTPIEEITPNLTEVATPPLIAEAVPNLTEVAAKTPIEEVTPNLTEVAATTPAAEVTPNLTEAATTTPTASSTNGFRDIAEVLLDPAFSLRVRELHCAAYGTPMHHEPIYYELNSIVSILSAPHLANDIEQLLQYSPTTPNHSLANRPEDIIEVLFDPALVARLKELFDARPTSLDIYTIRDMTTIISAPLFRKELKKFLQSHPPSC